MYYVTCESQDKYKEYWQISGPRAGFKPIIHTYERPKFVVNLYHLLLAAVSSPSLTVANTKLTSVWIPIYVVFMGGLFYQRGNVSRGALPELFYGCGWQVHNWSEALMGTSEVITDGENGRGNLCTNCLKKKKAVAE
jgi:hypothetical protein